MPPRHISTLHLSDVPRQADDNGGKADLMLGYVEVSV
jgi:hypothetical protein